MQKELGCEEEIKNLRLQLDEAMELLRDIWDNREADIEKFLLKYEEIDEDGKLLPLI